MGHPLGHTLTSRIVRTTTAMSLLGLLIVLVATFFVMDQAVNRAVKATIDDDFGVLSNTISLDADGNLQQKGYVEDSIDVRYWAFDTHGVQFLGQEATEHTSTNRLSKTVRELGTVEELTQREAHDHIYLAGPIHDRKGQQIAVLVVAENIGPYESTRNSLVIGLAIAGLLAAFGAALVSMWTVRRTLRPVREMAESAQSWSERNLDTRFDTSRGADEFTDLGRTLNTLMDRVARALRNEQRLTSEVAHELRTPLTGIRGEAELALLTTEDPQTIARLERILEQVDTMGANIRALVQIAREDDDVRRLTVRETISDLAAAFTPPEGVGLDVVVDDDADVLMPRDPLARSLAPLIDNALRHARSRVEVRARAQSGRLLVAVSDDGPGTTEDDFSGPGGLGLPLSRRIASSLGGRVVLTRPADPTEITLDVPID